MVFPPEFGRGEDRTCRRVRADYTFDGPWRVCPDWEGEMNPYVDEAAYCFWRAAGALSEKMRRDELCDVIIYFGFGVEKALKAVLYAVNPVFLLEDPKFENAITVLYHDKLTTTVQGQLHREKSGNSSLIAFQPSLVRAGKFSQKVMDHAGLLTRVADLRGVAAHRTVLDLNVAENSTFLLKVFHPTTLMFAEVLGFDIDRCYPDSAKLGVLAMASERLMDPQKLKDEMDQKLTKHRAIWEARKDNPHEVEYNRELTTQWLERIRRGMPYSSPMNCPSCAQTAVLMYEFEDKVDHEEETVSTVGAIATGLQCFYCDFQVDTYEQIDYFKLNERVAKAFSSPSSRR